jgi:hypothetical protein
VVLGRNHGLVAHLSDQILGQALRPKGEHQGYRCGAAYTNAVKTRTVILLLRVRYALSRKGQSDQFAEEVVTTGFESEGQTLRWFDPNKQEVLSLLESAEPAGNISPQERQSRLERALEEVHTHRPQFQAIADGRAQELDAAHQRLKQQIGGTAVKAKAYPPDILGIYVLLPGAKA